MAIIKRVENRPDIDLSTWELGFGDFDEMVGAKVTETLRQEFADDPPDMWLPYSYRNYTKEATCTPLCLNVTLPLGASDAQSPEYRVDLEAVLFDVFDSHMNGEAKCVEDEDGVRIAKDIAAELRRLAEVVDGWTTPGATKEVE